MSIWSELLFLHGHLTRLPEGGDTGRPDLDRIRERTERLRDLIGCPGAGAARRQEPSHPLLGVRGLA